MSKGAFNFFELHAEKFALGVAGVGLLAMLWTYMLGSPNSKEFGGQNYGPRDLLQAVYDESQRLDRAMKSANAEDPKIENYSDKLRSEVTASVFNGGDAPTLRMATALGDAIEVPGLEESEEAAGTIKVVTPLKPTTPAALTGRSLVIRKPIELSLAGTTPTPAPAPTAAPTPTTPGATAAPKEEAVELAWVSVGAYFDKKAQYQDMVNAKYAPYRSKVYVVGVDVERKERLANTEWSEWKPVSSGAMPKLEMREPVFDSQTGELVNREEIDQLFRLVRAQQAALLQPPFYTVEEGSSWEVPPIEGFEPEVFDEESTEDIRKPETPSKPPPTPKPPAPPPVGDRLGGGRTGGFGPGPVTPSNTAQQRREAQKEIREHAKEASAAANAREWSKLRDIAQRISGNEYANAGDKKKAERWLKKAEMELSKVEKPKPKTFGEQTSGDPRASFTGAPMATPGRAETVQLISHPEKGMPAVWFHDDTVEPGKTYQYRMRLKLWNRYVGRLRALQDPEQAKRAVILGDWSSPSDPITVTPTTHFYVKGGRETASLDVWKWRAGRWIRQAFDVGVGDVIGEVRKTKTGELDAQGDEERVDVDFTTGAIVLDVRADDNVPLRQSGKDGAFRYSEKKSFTVIYLDPADGQVKEKTQILDRNDRMRKRLEEEEV